MSHISGIHPTRVMEPEKYAIDMIKYEKNALGSYLFCGSPPYPLCPCVQIKPTFGLCQQCARPHMIALACCENMPVAMDDVIIPKTAVVATITTNSRKFILSILYYHKIYNIYEVL